MAEQNQVGADLDYPSMAAAIMGAALTLVLGLTIGRFLISHNVVEVFLREWIPFLLPFLYLLPDWAQEAPWVLGILGVAAVAAVRLLAEFLPRAVLYLVIVAIICTGVLIGLPIRAPASLYDWGFVSYVILVAFLGAAPRSNDFQS